MRLENIVKVRDVADLVTNEEGFGIVTARVSRDGVQPYMGYEVDYLTFGNSIINVYRSAAEVGSEASLATFAHATLTNDHPYEEVSLANWDAVAMGELSTDAKLVEENGIGYVEVTIYVKNKDAMAEILAGKRELSLGYTCRYDLTGGVTPDGQEFDAEQVDIKVNHCALVEKGRAGMLCRIVTSEDSALGTHLITARSQTDAGTPVLTNHVKKKDNSIMTDKNKVRVIKIADADIELEVGTADRVQTALDALTATHDKAVKELTTKHDTAIGVVNADLVKANDTIAELQKGAPTRDTIRAELAECNAITDTAKSLGLELKVADTDTPRSLKAAVIAHKMGDKCTITEDTADETVNAVYDALISATPATPAKRAMADQVVDSTGTDARATHDSQLLNARNPKKGDK